MGSERSACGESDTLTPFSLLSGGCGWDNYEVVFFVTDNGWGEM